MDQASDPAITFDAKGVCNYCHSAFRAANQHRVDKDQMPWVIYNIKKRGRGKKYDCVIGLSGGADSSYALHLLKQHNVRVFAYSIDNGWNTQISDENIMKLVEGMKIPFYRYTIDKDIFRELQKAFISSGVKNIEIPSDHLITSVAWKMARREGVKTIVSGGNWQTESIMPAHFGYSAHDLYHIKSIYKRFTGKSLTSLPTTSLLQYMWYRCVAKIKIVNILDHTDYNRSAAMRKLFDLYGWQEYGAKHEESEFTKWFQNVYLPQVHGLDKRVPHLASMIHSGQITREQAVNQLSVMPEPVRYPFEMSLPEPHVYTDYPHSEKIRKLAWRIYRHC